MSNRGDDTGAFLAGFVIGGLVGAAVAFILAPQSGEQTRAQLTARGHAWRESGEAQWRRYRPNVGQGHFEAWREAPAGMTPSDAEAQARIILNQPPSPTAPPPSNIHEAASDA